MMRSNFLLIVSMLVLSTSLSSAYRFKVGSKDGWAVKASGHYEVWASRIRFLVNDTLYFKYNKLFDSVYVVNKQDYDTCNIKNPIHKMHGGDSTFLLNKAGHFYFISGNFKNCLKGEKLRVVVLSTYHHEHHGPSLSPMHSPANAPGPSAHHGIAPVPHPHHSGFKRLNGSFGVGVVVALVLGSFAF